MPKSLRRLRRKARCTVRGHRWWTDPGDGSLQCLRCKKVVAQTHRRAVQRVA